LKHLGPDDQASIERLSHAIMNKFLHEPSVRLKAAAANGRGLAIVDAARYLFGLEHEAPNGETSGTEAESKRHDG
jgi:glutamyl-tRNA reductase